MGDTYILRVVTHILSADGAPNAGFGIAAAPTS